MQFRVWPHETTEPAASTRVVAGSSGVAAVPEPGTTTRGRPKSNLQERRIPSDDREGWRALLLKARHNRLTFPPARTAYEAPAFGRRCVKRKGPSRIKQWGEPQRTSASASFARWRNESGGNRREAMAYPDDIGRSCELPGALGGLVPPGPCCPTGGGWW